jgi:FkbM family methyltransferase
MKHPPIYDVGINDGQDSAFYIHKGWRVIAVEANPILCERASRKFAPQIQSNQLTILNVAISDAEGQLDFYVNLDNDHWSSLNPAWGTRANTRYETIKVSSMRFDRLIEHYGVPHYLKIDIEGGDKTVLNQLQNRKTEIHLRRGA